MINNTPFFVVNLEQDYQRKLHMINIGKSLNLELIFVKAISGENLSQEKIDAFYDKTLSNKKIGRGLSNNEIACALSHLSIYQRMISEGIQTAVILEDDAEISDDIHEIVNAHNNLPCDWDLILLGYYSEHINEKKSMCSFRDKKKITSKYKAVRLVEKAFGTHGYIINLNGANKLVKALNKIFMPIDYYTGCERYLNMYALSSRVVTLNQKLKQMGTIEQSRFLLSSAIIKPQKRNFFILFLKKIKLILWVKDLPLRIASVKKYVQV